MQMGGLVDGLMDGWMDGPTDGGTDGIWMDRGIDVRMADSCMDD